jgi:hypothetical protein
VRTVAHRRAAASGIGFQARAPVERTVERRRFLASRTVERRRFLASRTVERHGFFGLTCRK